MDTDTLITYVLLFLFFVLPTILKRRKKKAAQKAGEEKMQTTKTGFLGLGNALRGFLKELEKQAQEAKAAQKQASEASDNSIWELLDEREDKVPEMTTSGRAGTGYASAASDDPEPEKPYAASEAAKAPEEKPRARVKKVPEPQAAAPKVKGVQSALPVSALQQAVVWSEILGPPKAFRQD